MPKDIVSRLEKKIDDLLARQGLLLKENEKLLQACEVYAAERKSCRKQLDAILAKLDQLS